MKDRSVQHPQRYQQIPVEGTDDIFDFVPAPGEIAEEGTLINKSALLKDETAALFKDLPENPVPDDVLKILSKAALAGENGVFLPGGERAPLPVVTVGSYVGVGGTTNGPVLTIPENTKLVIISSNERANYNNRTSFLGLFIKPNVWSNVFVSDEIANTSGVRNISVNVEWTENSLFFYSQSKDSKWLLNSLGVTYSYVIIEDK